MEAEIKILQEENKVKQQQHMHIQQQCCTRKYKKQQQALDLKLDVREKWIKQTQKQIELRCAVENRKKTSSVAQEGM